MLNVETNVKTGEKVYKEVLENGLRIYICPKPGYAKKIGMYGTEYGSIDNDFIQIDTGERIKVEDGIAHFLEHKLFEQEGDNALDVFAKMGVSSNAYTSFDHTVYFFETNDKFEECVSKLLDFVNNPYFTDENVEKEKGIIAQELKMYEDDPNSVVYYNVLRAMYKNFPLNVDIGGTVESVYRIDKEALYACYNTFYNPANMYVIIIGDVDVEKTIEYIKLEYSKRINKKSERVIRFIKQEPEHVATKEIVKQMDVYMPYLCLGFKHNKCSGRENAKNTIIVEFINEICFSNMSDFYEKMYNDEIINEPIQIVYESGKDFAHTIIFVSSKSMDECQKILTEYVKSICQNGIDKELFNVVKKKKIGESIYETEDLMAIHRDIIDSIILGTDVYEKEKVLENLTVEDINSFIKENLIEDKMVISKVIEKTK